MELAGLEPATSWVRCARRTRIMPICRAFSTARPDLGGFECPWIGGDWRGFTPENGASGANVGAESGSPASYRGPGYLELIALVPTEPGVPASTARLRLPWRIPGSTAAAAPFPREAAVIVGAVVRCTRDRRWPSRPAPPPDRHCGDRHCEADERSENGPRLLLSGRLLRETEGGEHSSTELTISSRCRAKNAAVGATSRR
jgi:hypothetical protein